MTSIKGIQFREATTADVPAMALCKLADPTDSVQSQDAQKVCVGVADDRTTSQGAEVKRWQPHAAQQALPARVGYVACANDAVIGYIAGHRTTRNDCAGEVQYLFVAPTYRRRGVATALLRLLAKWFQSQGAQKVCVGVADDSPVEAKPFFERVGAYPLKRNWYGWEDIGVITSSSFYVRPPLLVLTDDE